MDALTLRDCRLCGAPAEAQLCSACDLRRQADARWEDCRRARQAGDRRRARVYATEAVRLHTLAVDGLDGVSS